MGSLHKIDIGNNQWINWKKVDFTEARFEIDQWMNNIKPFWEHLEKHCAIGCCGLDALSFLPEDIKGSQKKSNLPHLKQDLIQLLEEVSNSERNCILSHVINCVCHKASFTELLQHIIKNID